MHTRTVALIVMLSALSLSGCGGHGAGAGRGGASAPAVMAATWTGGQAVALTGTSSSLRAVLFLDPESERSAEQARWLAQVRAEHPALVVAGVTTSADEAAIRRFRLETGFPGPVASDPERETVKQFAVEQRPALRVVNERGDVVGRHAITLLALLGRPASR